jgi:hypothetical protein
MPSFLNTNGTFLPTQIYNPAPATGTTIRLTAGETYVKQTGTLAALTALMPSNPKTGMIVSIVPGATITTLTLQTDAAGAIAGAPTAGVANTAINMLYNGTAWVRRL